MVEVQPSFLPVRDSQSAPGAGLLVRGFMLLYMTAFVLDMAEDWKHPVWTAAMLAVVGGVIVTGLRWGGFICFLVGSTFTLATLEGLQGGNHNNLSLFANLLLLSVLGVFAARGRWNDDEALLACVGPPLRVTIALVYFFAGFHKLNWDYLNPDVSCGVKFAHDMTLMAHLPFTLRDLPPALRLIPALLVLVWELGAGIALLVKRLQVVALLVCWVMHSVLAMMVFFDFSSFAFSMLWLFVPARQAARLSESPLILGALRFDRLTVLACLNLFASLVAGAFYLTRGEHRYVHYSQGLVFNVSVLIAFWPLLRQLLPRVEGHSWSGVCVWPRQTHVVLALVPAFIVFWGMNPYLGLRTTGVFTMFSNLRTERYSNHILLQSNPLKIFSFQEDLVEIISLDPKHATRPDRNLDGLFLPAVAFRQQLRQWRREGLADLSATYRYGGELYVTDDILRNGPWDLDAFDPAALLMDFRVVQPDGEPTKCRW